MWTYRQTTGDLTDPTGNVTGKGYSGNGLGLNNPAAQAIANVGPIPQGRWVMSQWVENDPKCGLGVIYLDPAPGNDMAGRDGGFRIHGDNALANQSASDGCIIFGHAADRQAIWASGDHLLEVTS